MYRHWYLAPLLLVLFVASPSFATNEEGTKFLEENKNKEGVVTLDSGLQYKVLKKGSGTKHPTVNSPCLCHYKGTLLDGTQFDSSYDRGEPTTFAPNQVIKGWTEAMQLMVEGDKWEMYIPSDLAYGDRGSPPKIPGESALIFQMELIEIKGDSVPALTCSVDFSSGSPNASDDCNEKETKYIQKAADKFPNLAKVQTEIPRLKDMKKEKMKKDLLDWLERRIHILKQFETYYKESEGKDDL